MASASNRQSACYLTLELTFVELGHPVTLHARWVCLCLDNGRVGLTSLGVEGATSVAWERLA